MSSSTPQSRSSSRGWRCDEPKVADGVGDVRCRRQRDRAEAGRAACTCPSTTGSRTGPTRARPRRSRSASPTRSAARHRRVASPSSLSHLSGALGIPVPGAGDLDPNTRAPSEGGGERVACCRDRRRRDPRAGRGGGPRGASRRRSTCESTARSSAGSHRARPSRASPKTSPKCTSRTPTSRGRGSCNGCSTVIPRHPAVPPRHRLDGVPARRRRRDRRFRSDRVLGARHRMPMTPEQIHQRRWMTLGVLCLSLVVISVDNTILNVALPSIVRDLGAEGSQLQWIIDSYTIVFAGMLLTAGVARRPLRAQEGAHCRPRHVRHVLRAGARGRPHPRCSSSPAGSWGWAARSSSRRRCRS